MSNLHRRPWLKATTLSLLAALILITAQSAARADEISFDISTAGCFGNPCTPVSTAFVPGRRGVGGSAVDGTSLTFTSAPTFSGSSAGGLLVLDNLGSFTLSIDPAVAISPTNPLSFDGSFRLQITFNSPGLAVGQTAPFLFIVDGTLELEGDSVNIHFDDPDPFFRLTNNGSFSLHLSSVQFTLDRANPIQTVQLSAGITGANQPPAIPEPATLGLLATGLTGLIGAARRRRKRCPPSA